MARARAGTSDEQLGHRLALAAAWAPSSWSAARPPAGSRPPPRTPCTRWRTAGRRPRRRPGAARARRCPPARRSAPTRLRAAPPRPPGRPSRAGRSVTGRFLVAARSPSTSLPRSKGCRSPERLTTIRGTSSIRSKVVYRRPQPTHSRRRRMAAPSSATRESTTRSSSARHHGHRTVPRLVPVPVRPGGAPAVSDRGPGRRVRPVGGQGTRIRSPGNDPVRARSSVSLATSGRGSAPGSARSAIDHRESPGRDRVGARPDVPAGAEPVAWE